MFCNKYEFHNEDKRRWDALFRRIRASGNGDAVFKELNMKYRDPRRKYYTAVYIRHCLDEFRQVRELLLKPDAVEMALWFHKIASDPFRKDAPLRSEKLARDILYSVGGLPDRIAESALELITVTGIDCRLSSPDTDASMIADIVLSPLGAIPSCLTGIWSASEESAGESIRCFCKNRRCFF